MLNVSLVLVLLLTVALLLWKGGVAWYKALPCVLLGFCLASTSAAPTIQHGLTSVAGLISRITL